MAPHVSLSTRIASRVAILLSYGVFTFWWNVPFSSVPQQLKCSNDSKLHIDFSCPIFLIATNLTNVMCKLFHFPRCAVHNFNKWRLCFLQKRVQQSQGSINLSSLKLVNLRFSVFLVERIDESFRNRIKKNRLHLSFRGFRYISHSRLEIFW